jgi:dienelactone hydrolase
MDTANPLVIINHGTNANGEQGRERAINPTKFFLEHGYTVVLPMRRGYSNSTGEKTGVHSCNLTRYGLENAADVEDVVIWLKAQDRFKHRKIIMIGQSTGGLTTMAYSSLPNYRVDAIINFHGGMRPSSPTDCKWDARIDAFRTYAKTSSPPSLWFYTANDHSSNPEYIAKLYKAFTDAGGKAKLVQLPAFKNDGHILFGDADGGPIWQPLVLDYLQELKLYPLNNN